jgi:Putative adhesin
METAPAPSQGAPIATREPRHRGPGSGLLLAVALALVLAAIASATFSLIGLWWLRSDTTTTDLGVATALRVRQSCGSVTIREGSSNHIVLTSKRWMALKKPTLTTSRSGATVDVSGGCPGFALGGTSGSLALTLVVPHGSVIDVSSADGGVHLVGLSGRITADASDGSIRADDLTAATVTATSSDGSVHLSFASDPDAVEASSSDGSVSIAVPDDGTSYAVDAHSSDGSAHVGIATDPKATRSIRAHSSDGSVTVSWR